MLFFLLRLRKAFSVGALLVFGEGEAGCSFGRESLTRFSDLGVPAAPGVRSADRGVGAELEGPEDGADHGEGELGSECVGV